MRIAKGGGSTHEIASFTGHKSLKEVEEYTRSARRRKLATRALGLLAPERKANG